jgi:protein SCO1/2
MRRIPELRREGGAGIRLAARHILVTLVLASVASGCAAPARLAGAVREPPLVVTDVMLPDVAHGGGLVPLAAPPGGLRLIYFGYTSCPDICPTTLSDITVALMDLPDELADRVEVGMVTVDPERDTDAQLTGYLGQFFDDSLALRTTDPGLLAGAASAFGVQYEVEEHAAGDAYAVAHTAVTYAVNDSGTVVVEWPFGTAPEAMTSDITILLTR